MEFCSTGWFSSGEMNLWARKFCDAQNSRNKGEFEWDVEPKDVFE